jgi:hypothetical protein
VSRLAFAALTATYSLGAAIALWCASVAARGQDTPTTLVLALASLLILGGLIAERRINARDRAIQQYDHDLCELARACCTTGWATLGRVHDPDTCTHHGADR